MASHDPNYPAEKFEPFSAPEEAPPKSGKGCFFWGCLISSILALLIIVFIVFLLFTVRGAAIDFIKKNTSTEPAELPTVTLTPEEQEQVVERWEDFRAAMDKDEATELHLNSQEFNVVAQHVAEQAKDHVFFNIEGDKLAGTVSIPVGDIGQKVLRTDQLAGRYFNGQGTFDVFLRNGLLVLTLQDGEANGKPIPDEVLQQLKTQNLAENLNNDPEQRALFAKLASIQIKDGEIIFRTSAAGEEPAPPAEEGTTEPAPAPEAEAPVSEPETETPTVEPAEPEAQPAPENPEEPAPPSEENPTEEPPPALSFRRAA